MKNIEYLEQFFKKHNLSGQVKVKYTGVLKKDDDYMSEITINDNIILMNDIRFDIDSELNPDVGEQWMEVHKETGIGFMDWMLSNNHYMPKNIDRSSIEEYHKEIEDLMDQVKKSIDKVFEYGQKEKGEN